MEDIRKEGGGENGHREKEGEREEDENEEGEEWRSTGKKVEIKMA